jgi:hypothetical protein
MQKFHKYDHVQIAKDLGRHMSHFTSDCEAIVMGSYADQFGGNNTNSYTIFIKEDGEHSWYEEWQLTLINKNQECLFKEWENKRQAGIVLKSDLDWIFKNGKEILEKGCSGPSIHALAACLTSDSLWGSSGEGIMYYENSMIILSVAKPFLEKGDKEGWLKFCEINKKDKQCKYKTN